MTVIPLSPKVFKGAIVALDPFNPLASVIIFQYNPDQLSRSLTPMGQVDPKLPVGVQRLTGPPKETISLKVTINAADQLESSSKIATEAGIYPQLAAMEMLLYPKSSLVIANTILASLGTMEIQPPEAPLTLFIYGLKRVVPVRLTSYSVTEQYHDPSLNPIVADATLSLQVLSYLDFQKSQKGYYVFLAYQIVKEAMATIGSANNVAKAGAGALNLM